MCRLLYILLLTFVVSAQGKNPLVSMSKELRKYIHGPFGSKIPNVVKHQAKMIQYSNDEMRDELNFMDLALIDEASANMRNILAEMSEEAVLRTEYLLSVSTNNSYLMQKADLLKELENAIRNGSDWRTPKILLKEVSLKQKSFCNSKNELFPILKDHNYSDNAFSSLYHIHRTLAILKTIYATFEKFIRYSAVMNDSGEMESFEHVQSERYEDVMNCLEMVNQWREKQSFFEEILFTDHEKKIMLSEEVSMVPSHHNLFLIGDEEQLTRKYNYLSFRICGSSNRKNFFVPQKYSMASFNNSHCTVSVIRYPKNKARTIESWDIITDNFITAAVNIKKQRKMCPGKTIAHCFARRIENADEIGLLAVAVTDVGQRIVSSAGPMEQVSMEMEILNKKRKIVGFFGVQLETISL